MPIEQIAPAGSVDATTNVYSKAVADKSLETFLANKKAIEVAQAAKDAKIEAAKLAQTAKENRADEAEAFQEAKETRETVLTEKYAKSDAAKLQANKENMEEVLAAKTDQTVVSRRAARTAASRAAYASANVNSKAEADHAIEAYQENRAAQEVAQSDKVIETARLVDAGIITDSRSAAITTSHVDLRD